MVRCPICHALMERYDLPGYARESDFNYGCKCKQGHYALEWRELMVYERVLGSWFIFTSPGVDPLDGLLYALYLQVARLIWYARCGYRHVRRQTCH